MCEVADFGERGPPLLSRGSCHIPVFFIKKEQPMLCRRKALSLAAVLVPHLCVAGIAAAQQTRATPAPEPSPAPAAEATPAEEATSDRPARKKSAEEEIVVTGSRIRRKDLTTPAPIAVISKQEIQASGKVSIGD